MKQGITQVYKGGDNQIWLKNQNSTAEIEITCRHNGKLQIVASTHTEIPGRSRTIAVHTQLTTFPQQDMPLKAKALSA